MADDQSVVDYIVEQIAAAGDIRSRQMFGGQTIYCDNKIVALVCDGQLFVKPTNSGREFIGTVEEVPAYPGAKPRFLVKEDKWDDDEWLSGLIKLTAAELPLPKKKKSRRKP